MLIQKKSRLTIVLNIGARFEVRLSAPPKNGLNKQRNKRLNTLFNQYHNQVYLPEL
jgi:hypothetical protein